MDDRGGSNPEEGEEAGYTPKWPERPARTRAPRGSGQGGETSQSVGANQLESQPQGSASSWTSTPTSYSQNVDAESASKETRVLPVVERSRFDIGRQGSPSQVSHHQAMPTQARKTPAQPSQRDLEREQYEQTRAGYPAYDRYEEKTQLYTPAYRPQPATARTSKVADSRRAEATSTETARPRRRFGWLLWLLGGIVAIALVGVVAFALAWQGEYAGRVFPGVTVLDVDLSGKTPEEARKLLKEKTAAFTARPITFTWQGKDWQPSVEQIGIKVDLDATVDEVYGVGRTSDAIANVSQQWVAAQAGYEVPLIVRFDETALEKYLNTIADAEINQELFEGDIRLSGAEVQAMPGKEGRTLRVYDTIVAVRQKLADLEPGTIELPVDVVQPTVSAEEIEEVRALLEIRISSPLTATTPIKSLVLSREALVRFTVIERNPDRAAERHIELGWNERELKILGDRWATEATTPPQNARFAWNGGAVSVLKESVEGFEIEPDAVIASIKEHADKPEREYALPGKVLTPAVSSKDIDALGIKEKLGTGTSTFKGSSAERATNIKVASDLLNGAVVPPGGTFSFLQTIGGIDEEHGFVEGYVIAAERTQRGVGGGVCQVSTTTFRAMFWSGVEITERNEHSYRVGWYEAGGEPVGFDAAVFDPGVDLKFVNNTPGYILIEAVVGGDTLTVNMYGTKLPGEVKMEGPVISNRVPPPPDVYEVDSRLPPGTRKQVETARAGMSVTITRRIVTPGQPDRVDQFRSTYKAWPNWYVVASPSQIPGGSVMPGGQ